MQPLRLSLPRCRHRFLLRIRLVRLLPYQVPSPVLSRQPRQVVRLLCSPLYRLATSRLHIPPVSLQRIPHRDPVPFRRRYRHLCQVRSRARSPAIDPAVTRRVSHQSYRARGHQLSRLLSLLRDPARSLPPIRVHNQRRIPVLNLLVSQRAFRLRLHRLSQAAIQPPSLARSHLGCPPALPLVRRQKQCEPKYHLPQPCRCQECRNRMSGLSNPCWNQRYQLQCRLVLTLLCK